MSFVVRFEDETTTLVHGADAYEQEGPLTTFFDRNGGGGLAPPFTLRAAPFRTDRIVAGGPPDAGRHSSAGPSCGPSPSATPSPRVGPGPPTPTSPPPP